MIPVGGRGGFTIVELALVLVIIAILGTLAVSVYVRVANKARFTEAKSLLKHLQKTELIYFTDHNRYTENVALLDFNPVQYDYYNVSVSLLDNGLRYIGYAHGVRAMEGDLWSITPEGEPLQDNAAKAGL